MSAVESAVRYLCTPRSLPPVFTLKERIAMRDACNEIEDLAERVEFELPALLRPLKARA